MSEKDLNYLGEEDLLKNMKKACMDFCEHCLQVKANWVQFKTSKHKNRGILDFMHTHIQSLVTVTSNGGSR